MPTPTRFPRRDAARAALVALLPAVAPVDARAQPTAAGVDGAVTLIVPYTPGTGPDVLARLLAPFLGARLGHAVVVDNRAGASGNIGTQAVARAAPDGRTLMLQVNTFVMNPSLFRQVPYDPVHSFTPVALLTEGDLALVVNPDVPADGARAFAELARARPGGLDYASPGNGTPQHLGMALFSQVAGITLNHVPYRGSAPAIQDLLGKRVAAMFLPVHTALPLAANGQIRLLAVGGDRRAPAAPAVPTLAESGFPGAQADLWYGLLGPAGLPPALVARLNDDLRAWLAEPATRASLLAQGMRPAPATPDAFAEMVRRDFERWALVIREAGIVAD